jgi:hypothetical protein
VTSTEREVLHFTIEDNNMSKATEKKTADDDLTKQLKETFPASDPTNVTRAPADKSDMSASRIDRLPPKVEPPKK